MQKLVWQNANGDEINLTGGNYGITEWEGFSNASLNIQNQQVPFQDGAVFLDALIEPRELSVTLKMQDKGNLEARYEMRRELIHALNPKLGEGYLIYTNDFISKRIKCIPQIPLFETHNSDTRGTPKASLAWTACEPYWEDLEETSVLITPKNFATIVNEGDIKTNAKILISPIGNVTSPSIINYNNNNNIKYNGVLTKEILINTNAGEKSAKEVSKKFIMSMCNLDVKKTKYIESLAEYYYVTDYVIYKTKDGFNFEYIETPVLESGEVYVDIEYSKELNKLILLGNNFLYYGESTQNMQKVTFQNVNFNGIALGSNHFVAIADNGVYYYSSDGINWTLAPTIIYQEPINLNCITYYPYSNLFIIGGRGASIFYVEDSFENIETYNMLYIGGGNSICKTIAFRENEIVLGYDDGLFVIYGNIPVSVSVETFQGERYVLYSDKEDCFYVAGYSIAKSQGYGNELRFENKGALPATERVDSFLYIKESEVYVVTYRGTIYESKDIDDPNNIPKYKDAWFLGNKGLCSVEKKVLNYGDTMTITKDGINWNKCIAISGGASYSNVRYIKTLNSVFGISSQRIGKSTDGGEHWELLLSIGGNDLVYSGIKYFRITSFSVYMNSELTQNNWSTIKTADTNGYFFKAEIIGNKLFVAENISYENETGKVYSTLNNGNSWSAELTIDSRINDIKAFDDVVIVIGNNGNVYVNIEGAGFTKIELNLTTSFYGICKDNRQNYYIVGENGILLKSNNALDWQVIYTGINLTFYDVAYLADKGLILFSVDEYESINSHPTIFFISEEFNKNVIQKISSDSNMNFALDIGENKINTIADNGKFNAILTYRQKYLGV